MLTSCTWRSARAMVGRMGFLPRRNGSKAWQSRLLHTQARLCRGCVQRKMLEGARHEKRKSCIRMTDASAYTVQSSDVYGAFCIPFRQAPTKILACPATFSAFRVASNALCDISGERAFKLSGFTSYPLRSINISNKVRPCIC